MLRAQSGHIYIHDEVCLASYQWTSLWAQLIPSQTSKGMPNTGCSLTGQYQAHEGHPKWAVIPGLQMPAEVVMHDIINSLEVDKAGFNTAISQSASLIIYDAYRNVDAYCALGLKNHAGLAGTVLAMQACQATDPPSSILQTSEDLTAARRAERIIVASSTSHAKALVAIAGTQHIPPHPRDASLSYPRPDILPHPRQATLHSTRPGLNSRVS